MAGTGEAAVDNAAAENGGPSKRRKIDEENQQPKTINEYRGFSFQDAYVPLQVDVIRTQEFDRRKFFDAYVSKRRPCVLDSLPKLPSGESLYITKTLLDQVAGDKMIQVEKRPNTNENFGQNHTASRQVLLTVSEFLKTICNESSELLYWSTQEDTDDPYNTPCRQLLDKDLIRDTLDQAGNLILSSCNLWIGKTMNGASSGLHHDYHDNFYMLLQGRKRFRLFSPDCAPAMSTFGTVERIHFNGRISYVGHEARADGVPLECLRDNNESEDDDEEEVVLGKGFDYVSDSEDGDFDGADDFDELMGKSDEANNGVGEQAEYSSSSPQSENGPPENFSRINPTRTDRAALEKDFPAFASCREVMVDLQAGQVLYLPAGWFHEVTSFSDTSTSLQSEDDESGTAHFTVDSSLSGSHVALNYWYHPPDALDNLNNPYKDDFWKKEEEQRLSKPLNGSSN